jgi:hypothetical protein
MFAIHGAGDVLAVVPDVSNMLAHLSGVLAPKTPEWPSSTRWFWSKLFT